MLKLAIVRVNEQTGEAEILFDHDLKTHLLEAAESLSKPGFRKRHRRRAEAAYDQAEQKLRSRTSEIN